MAKPSQIITTAQSLSYLGKGDTATDIELGRVEHCKRRAEAVVRKWIGANITTNTYTHYLPKGQAFDIRDERLYMSRELLLPEFPLRSITSIYEDGDGRFGQLSGAFAATSLLTAGTDYYFPTKADSYGPWGKVIRVNGEWSAIPGSIKITYVAGWSEDELHGDVSDPTLDASDIQLGVLKTLAEIYNEMVQQQAGRGATGAIKSESLADYSVEYDTANSGAAVHLPKDVQILLRRYKRIGCVL